MHNSANELDQDTQPLATGARTCPRCGSPFTCGILTEDEACWCFALPHIISLDDKRGTGAASGCLCMNCLQAEMAKYMRTLED